ncbi:MAG: hypothetical protein H0V82_00220 [Candidatus Protochlamydia sp.]|nr:hypothetical protein [Candidatus Protochlamydia sp.]
MTFNLTSVSASFSDACTYFYGCGSSFVQKSGNTAGLIITHLKMQGDKALPYLQNRYCGSAALFGISLSLLYTADKISRFVKVQNGDGWKFYGTLAFSLALWISGSLAFCHIANLPLRAIEVAGVMIASVVAANVIISIKHW